MGPSGVPHPNGFAEAGARLESRSAGISGPDRIPRGERIASIQL
jgi:hypothetical protein